MNKKVQKYKQVQRKFGTLTIFMFCVFALGLLKESMNHSKHKSTEQSNRSVIIYYFCDFISSTIDKDKDNLTSLAEFCRNVNEIYSMTSPDVSSYEISYVKLLFYVVCFILMLYFLIKATVSEKEFFDLTENQYWHYNWIYELYDLGVFKNKKEYDQWMRGFENRYSDELHEAMNLVFKIRD